jgi:hypothetical protein
MPVHHLLEQILNEYIVAAGIQSVQPLSQSVNSLGTAVSRTGAKPVQRLGGDSKTGQAAGFLTANRKCVHPSVVRITMPS